MLSRQEIDKIKNEPPLPIDEKFSTNDHMAGVAYEHAKKVMVDDGAESFVPTWVLLTENGRLVVVGTPFDMPEGDEEAYKDYLAHQMRKTMQELGVIRYTYTSEAWVVVRTKDQMQGNNLKPSQCEDRKEVIVIVSADHNEATLRLYYIERDDNGKVVNLKRDDCEGVQQAGGRFANLLDSKARGPDSMEELGAHYNS